MHEPWDQVKVEWEKIPEVCRNLVENMPRRVGPVIKVKRGQTMYWPKN